MRTGSRNSSSTHWTATWLLVGADAVADQEAAPLPPFVPAAQAPEKEPADPEPPPPRSQGATETDVA